MADYTAERRSDVCSNPYMATHKYSKMVQDYIYLATNPLLLCTYIQKPPCTCRVFMCTHSWLMRDTSIVHLNKRCCHLELGVLQQLKLLQWLGMVHRPQIVYECSSSHDKIKQQCCLLCTGLNFGLSKLPRPCSNFLCCTLVCICRCNSFAIWSLEYCNN